MPDRPDPHTTDDELRALPILREIGVEVRAHAAEAAHREQLAMARVARRRRLTIRIGGPVLAVGLAAALVLPVVDLGGQRLSPGAAAAAALDADDDVLHLVLRGGAVQPDGTPQTMQIERRHGGVFLGRRSEQWHATGPVRFRIVTDAVDRDGHRIGTVESGRDGQGRSWERDTAGRVRSDDDARIDPSLLAEVGSDPVSGLRRLLESDRLRENGTATVAGRTARVFSGETPGRSNGQGGWTADTKIVYYADAETSRPLRIEGYFRPPLHFAPDTPEEVKERTRRENSEYQLTTRLDVETFQRQRSAPTGAFQKPKN